MAIVANQETNFPLQRVFGSSLNRGKHWYALSSNLCGCKLSRFSKGKFFELFPSEIVRVKSNELWRENGERVPLEWFSIKRSNSEDEVYVATLFGILGALLKQTGSSDEGFLASRTFQVIMEKINNIDVSEAMAQANVKQSTDVTPKTKRIGFLEKELDFFTQKVRDAEIAKSGIYETPPNTPHTMNSVPSIKGIESSKCGVITKRRQLKAACSRSLEEITEVCNSHNGSLGRILAYGYLYGSEKNQMEVKTAIDEAVEVVTSTKGVRTGMELALSEEMKQRQTATMRVPDWVQVFVKLSTKLPDNGWQTLLNFLNLGRSGREEDLNCLLTKNMVKACKSVVFSRIQSVLGIAPLDHNTGIPGYSVSLGSALVWAIREANLHHAAKPTMVFNIKLDGRPFAGKDQVSVGVVAVDVDHASSESCGSVFPLAIGNCKENRQELPKLIRRLNSEKNAIKEKGITIDGKLYRIKFVVTLDYKSLLLLIQKIDENGDLCRPLGGQGFDVEFCLFCTALRACKEHLSGRFDEACLSCLQSKANIGKWTGIRDDLEFLLDEDLSHIQLCSLHQEMRNTEQLLGSLGLFSYRIGSLKSCNEAVAVHGPENTRQYDRIQVKLRTGQQTAVTKSNIHVSSMSGSTERAVLVNAESIVEESLPLVKVKQYYRETAGACNHVVLGYVTHYENVKQYLQKMLDGGIFMRDYGNKQENIQLNDAKDLKKFITGRISEATQIQEEIEESYLRSEQSASSKTALEPPKKKKRGATKTKIDKTSDAMVNLAAKLQVDHFKKVFQEWKEICHVIRYRVFENHEEEEIDIHDVKCKLWGLLLRHLFGVTLGMGDYVHLTVGHSAMLFRQHRSFRHYSNQGFEASHKEQRMLYSRATSHDASAEAQSINQILTHWYSERLLWLRYQFVQAQECLTAGRKKFYFRGCGWKAKSIPWSQEERVWINVMVDLFTKLFGPDYLDYQYRPDHGTTVSDTTDPRKSFSYDHDVWEASYAETCRSALSVIPSKWLKRISDNQPARKDISSCSDLFDDILPLEEDWPKVEECVSHPALEVDSSDSQANEVEQSQPSTDYHALQPNLSSSIKPTSQLLQNFTASRSERVAVCTPPVMNSLPTIQPLFKCPAKESLTDPFSLHKRPSETTVTEAEACINATGPQGQQPAGVEIEGLGVFSEEGLYCLRKFCSISALKHDIRKEIHWLDQVDGFSDTERSQMARFLWHKPPNEVICKEGVKMIDVEALTNLVGERYLDNMTMDVCIMKYVALARERGVAGTLYLPFELWDWLKKLSCDQLSNKMAAHLQGETCIEQVIAMVHFSTILHWGLLVIDIKGRKLYFDDGYNSRPEMFVIEGAKKILDCLCKMFPLQPSLQSLFWTNMASASGFGMDNQTVAATVYGQGSGSCGVGVILAAKDFIDRSSNAVNNLSWKYKDMRLHRKRLMLQIISWK